VVHGCRSLCQRMSHALQTSHAQHCSTSKSNISKHAMRLESVPPLILRIFAMIPHRLAAQCSTTHPAGSQEWPSPGMSSAPPSPRSTVLGSRLVQSTAPRAQARPRPFAGAFTMAGYCPPPSWHAKDRECVDPSFLTMYLIVKTGPRAISKPASCGDALTTLPNGDLVSQVETFPPIIGIRIARRCPAGTGSAWSCKWLIRFMARSTPFRRPFQSGDLLAKWPGSNPFGGPESSHPLFRPSAGLASAWSIHHKAPPE